MASMLELSAHLPDVHVPAGHVVINEGGTPGGIWVLVSGALEVSKSDVPITTLTHPGAMVGEMSLLLGIDHSATVTATQPSVVRHAADGDGFLKSDPVIATLVAIGLAERLRFVTTYLADLKNQYRDIPGLSMLSDVLTGLEQRQAPTAIPGSRREPDPEY
jgi:CRP/FNR family transcriptional regulator, cyclic AMP receptor protein